jgi:prephenate dehydrogenase
MRIKIVGTGLIGTSLALAWKMRGHEIELADKSEAHLALASHLLGEVTLQHGAADVVVIATPVQEILTSLQGEFDSNPEAIFIDIGGLKTNLLLEVARIPGLNARFCSSHPMAGREVSGPESARADLFLGRPWIITPSAQTERRTLTIARELATETGASIFELAPEEHDSAIALVSHLPQVVSSLLGGAILEGESEYLVLAGQGLRDVSRLAASDIELWSELLIANKSAVLPLLEVLGDSLSQLREHLESADYQGVSELLRRGNEGRSRIPGKHGGQARNYHQLPIVIDDKPGQLARIFLECAQANVNIEDLSMEHSPGQETGLITLSLSEADATKLYEHLTSLGWLAHLPRAISQ